MGVDILQLPDSREDNFISDAPADDPLAGNRQVQVLLWEYIKGLLKEAEQEEVKNALGRGAIEENEQLFREATSLDEILGDLQQRTEKQTEVQRLFETPARSMVEDEIRLLLETLHASSDDTTARELEHLSAGDAQQVAQEEPASNDEEEGSSPESFYDIPLVQKKSTSSKIRGSGQAERVAVRRDCHSAPIPAQSPKDKQILAYLVTRPSTSGSLRPQSSNGLRPGTAYLPRTASPSSQRFSLPRPQTAAVTWDVQRGTQLNQVIYLEGFRLASPRTPNPDPFMLQSCSGRNSLDPISWEAARTGDFYRRPASSISLQNRLSFEGSPWDLPSRPGTQQGRGSEGASRPSTASSASIQRLNQVVEEVADRLNVFQIEVVAEPLKRALADERAALLEDIEYLHQLIDMEADLHHQASRPPPSIKDLRDYSARLEASFREHIRERAWKQNGPTRVQQNGANSSQSGANSYRTRLFPEKSLHLLDSKLNGSNKATEANGKQGNHRARGEQLPRELHNKVSNSLPVDLVRSETSDCWMHQGLQENDTLGVKRSSSSKVHRLRSLVMDSQTEASGATSLCRAHLT